MDSGSNGASMAAELPVPRAQTPSRCQIPAWQRCNALEWGARIPRAESRLYYKRDCFGPRGGALFRVVAACSAPQNRAPHTVQPPNLG